MEGAAVDSSEPGSSDSENKSKGRGIGTILQIVASIVTANLFNMTLLAALYPIVVSNIPGYDIREAAPINSSTFDIGGSFVSVMQLVDLLGRLAPR